MGRRSLEDSEDIRRFTDQIRLLDTRGLDKLRERERERGREMRDACYESVP